MTLRLLSFAAAAATALTLLAAPAQAAAPHPLPGAFTTAAGSTGSGGADDGSTSRPVLNRDLARYMAHNALDASSAVAGRRALLADLDLPADLRVYFQVGPVVDHRFTFTAVGDQGCLTWAPDPATGTRTARFTPQACTPAERRVDPVPLYAAAAVTGRIAQLEVADDHGKALVALNPAYLRLVAGLVAPRGVRVTGVRDDNHDGVDDDGRVAFRRAGRVTCAQLPVTGAEAPRVVHTGCGHLPDRDMTAVVLLAWQASVTARADHVGGLLWRLSDTLHETVADFTAADLVPIRADLPHGYTLTRTAPLEFTVASKHCTVTLTFTEDIWDGYTLGTPACD